jgi:selenocysteine-specific elongation factor
MLTDEFKPNVNVGIVGHVDAGKTSLARFISTTASTAAFDKSPQSQERGITLDLGFSSLTLPTCQVTLVDCPGHASLMLSVICASAIIDAIVLVVDVERGLQTQTAECIILAEIVTSRLCIALTKVDLLPKTQRDEKIQLAIEKLKRALKDTKFSQCLIVPVSDRLMDTKATFLSLLETILPNPPLRDSSGSTIVAVDHCFTLKGQGTVMTGTILAGSVSINDRLNCEGVLQEVKIRSIQSFKRPLKTARQGDRVGLGVGAVDSRNIERTILCTPGSIIPVNTFLMEFSPVKYFKRPLKSRTMFHFVILHQAVMGVVIFFKLNGTEYEWVETANDDDDDLLALVMLKGKILIPKDGMVVALKLDLDIRSKQCRVAFYGRVRENLQKIDHIKIYQWKLYEYRVDRVVDAHRIIGIDDAGNNATIIRLIGLDVQLFDKEKEEVIAHGKIDSTFGTSGKFNVVTTFGFTSSKGPTHLIIRCRRKQYLHHTYLFPGIPLQIPTGLQT